MASKSATDVDSFDESSSDENLLSPVESFTLTPSPESETLQATKKRLQRVRPKVECQWRDEDIYKLIHLIKKRRALWDKSCDEYKQPKEGIWQEIADFFHEKYSMHECKAKWGNLRVAFKTNLAKYRSKNSEQSTDEKKKTTWRFYKPMLFLDTMSMDPLVFENHTEFEETQIKSHKKRKFKVSIEWSDNEIIRLINSVEMHVCLWNAQLAEYKCKAVRDNAWKEIALEFDNKIPVCELCAKWTNLRVQFKAYYAKYMKIKSGQAKGESSIQWRFFSYMAFLAPAEDIQLTPPIFNSLDAETDEKNVVPNEIPTPSEVRDYLPEQHLKRAKLSSTSSSPLLNFKARDGKNKYQIFGEYVAAELQNLPDFKADFVQRKLNRTFLDLLDEVELMPPPLPLLMQNSNTMHYKGEE